MGGMIGTSVMDAAWEREERDREGGTHREIWSIALPGEYTLKYWRSPLELLRIGNGCCVGEREREGGTLTLKYWRSLGR